ncbi:MAG: hypothetical protein ACFBSE_08175 [Prochloraceae cyanobacterium]
MFDRPNSRPSFIYYGIYREEFTIALKLNEGRGSIGRRQKANLKVDFNYF